MLFAKILQMVEKTLEQQLESYLCTYTTASITETADLAAWGYTV